MITALRTGVRISFGAAALIAPHSPATAQLLEDPTTIVVPPVPQIDTDMSIFARKNDISVGERMLPALTAQGVEIGDFRLYPGVAAGPVVTSNVFADNRRRKAGVGFVVRPEAVLRTEAGTLNAEVYARGDLRRYLGHSSENTEEGLAGAQASLGFAKLSRLAAGVQYGSFVEPRRAADSPPNAAKPLEYSGLSGYLRGTFEGASTRLVFNATASQLRFRDTPLRGGGTLWTRDRDRSRYAGSLRAERAISPALSVYAAGSLNRIDYRVASTSIDDRDSSGWGAYVGSSFEATRLVIGDVRVGYLRQKFDLANVKPIKGLAAQADVTLFPTRLWDVSLHAESSVQDTGVPGSRGVLRRGGSVTADFELRRYLILSAQADYYRDRYRGAIRTDDLRSGQLSATYLSHNHWNAALRYQFNARRCKCTMMANDFDEHRLSATLTFQH